MSHAGKVGTGAQINKVWKDRCFDNAQQITLIVFSIIGAAGLLLASKGLYQSFKPYADWGFRMYLVGFGGAAIITCFLICDVFRKVFGKEN